MDWGTELWDRCDVIEKHTHSGLELVEKYVKFVKERTEIEQNYAKQLRNLFKKFNLKRNSKDEPDVRLTSYQSFMEVLNETNDYAGQRELVAENMLMNICADLTKYLQELKLERKSYLMEAKKAQQTLESTNKQLESSKKRFEREWREAERASQNADKTDQDNNATKADVEKAKQQAHMRAHVAEECKNDYAAQLQNFNKEQKQFYFTDMPVIFNKMQELDERRMRKLAQGYILYSDIEKQVMPIIGKCLDGITKAGTNVNEKHDTMVVIEQNKSGFDRPGDVEFEDFSQGMNRTSSDGSVGTPKGSIDHTVKNRSKNFWIFSKKSKLSPSTLPPFSTPPAPSPINGPPSPKFGRDPLSYCLKEINKTVKPRISSFRTLRRSPAVTEDFTHLPPEQRRKRLQEKLEETGRRLQKETDQRHGWLMQVVEETRHDTNLTPSTTTTLTNRLAWMEHTPMVARPTPPPTPSMLSLMMTLRMRNWRRPLGTVPPCITFPAPAKAPSPCRKEKCWPWSRKTKATAGLASVGATGTKATSRRLTSPSRSINDARRREQQDWTPLKKKINS
ncbi:cdc42-interacting protein 4 homolog isoform X2 [Syngnathus acus]|uniref:cdc42-interacting protein 4 homolog isoform X2 n=1 Tax=Syngnathus acus TaxID=161584 RepID=UPI001885B96D|nr:cdc42-interacting protein 4 homolog isoform X2 [Syngnathus acus]